MAVVDTAYLVLSGGGTWCLRVTLKAGAGKSRRAKASLHTRSLRIARQRRDAALFKAARQGHLSEEAQVLVRLPKLRERLEKAGHDFAD